jgi:hypothetical protein
MVNRHDVNLGLNLSFIKSRFVKWLKRELNRGGNSISMVLYGVQCKRGLSKQIITSTNSFELPGHMLKSSSKPSKE